MIMQSIKDLNTPIGVILEGVGTDGLLLEAKRRYAVLPLDDDLLDYLLERSPDFASTCQSIRQEMLEGKFRTHDDVRNLFEQE